MLHSGGFIGQCFFVGYGCVNIFGGIFRYKFGPGKPMNTWHYVGGRFLLIFHWNEPVFFSLLVRQRCSAWEFPPIAAACFLEIIGTWFSRRKELKANCLTYGLLH